MRKEVKTSFFGGATLIIASMQMAHAQSIHATSLQSALCSPDALVLTFNAPLSDGDVTR